MNSNQVGNLGELKVIEACLKNGIDVFTPFGDGNVVDLILIVNGKCLKAQVKSSQTGAEDGVMKFKTTSNKSTRQGDPIHHYSSSEIDVFLFYSYVYDEVYVMLPSESPKGDVTIRHDIPAKPTSTMRFVKDYSFQRIFDVAMQHSG